MRTPYDYYAAREFDLVVEYFRRKAEGDFTVPVPSLTVFDHVIGSALATFPLATCAERELRAIYLGVGRPVSQAQARELIECSGIAAGIVELECEIDNAEAHLARLRQELQDLSPQGVDPDAYVPEGLNR